MVCVPERHRIEESFLVVVLELQFPRLAGVGGFVNSRRCAIADTENVCGLRIDRIDVAEVKCLVSDMEFLPSLSAINRAEDSRSGATGPRHLLTHRAHATQSSRDATCLRGPTRSSDHHEHEK